MTSTLHLNLYTLFQQFQSAKNVSKLYLFGYKQTTNNHLHVVNFVFANERAHEFYETFLPPAITFLGAVNLNEPLGADAVLKVTKQQLETRDAAGIIKANPKLVDEVVSNNSGDYGDNEFTFYHQISSSENNTDKNAVAEVFYKLAATKKDFAFCGNKVFIDICESSMGKIVVKQCGFFISSELKISGVNGNMKPEIKEKYIKKALFQLAERFNEDLTDLDKPYSAKIVLHKGQEFFAVLKSDQKPYFSDEIEKLVRKVAVVESKEEAVTVAPKASLELDFGKLLLNPHLELKYTAKDLYSIIKSNYIYYHYDCDGFDDAGWGCAYRSLQTIWSWLCYKGRVTEAPLSHRQIQEWLVKIGDKPSKFIGSRGWIGSFEIGYVMQNAANLDFQTLSSASGKDLDEHGRRLALHFEQDGAPVMIGGGQLAHTIIGVDYNRRSGECQYLVLDPHYVGKDTTAAAFKGKGISWQSNKFFNGKGNYNMLLILN